MTDIHLFLFGGGEHALFHAVHERFERLFARHDLGVRHEASLFVDVQHGLDVHQRADHRRGFGASAETGEMGEVVDGEEGDALFHEVFDIFAKLFEARALVALFDRVPKQQPFAHAGVEGVYGDYLAFGIFFRQLFGYARAAGVSSRKGGRKRQVEHVVSRLELFFESLLREEGLDHGSVAHFAAAHAGVKFFCGDERVDVVVFVVAYAHRHGQDLHVFAGSVCGIVRGGVAEYEYAHKVLRGFF